MNTDAEAMLRKKKLTACITALVAAVLVLISLALPWLKSGKSRGGGQITMSLLSIEACGGGECEKRSNFELARQLKTRAEGSEKQPGTSFAYFGLATLIVSILGALGLAAAGGLGLKDKFVREPIAITSVALIALCLALVLGCIFVAVKPGDGEFASLLGVSWPFFIFGTGIVGGIAGAQMIAKAFGPPEYDPYADPTMPT